MTTIEQALHKLLFEAGLKGAYFEVDQDFASEIGAILMTLRELSPVSDAEIERLSIITLAKILQEKRVK